MKARTVWLLTGFLVVGVSPSFGDTGVGGSCAGDDCSTSPPFTIGDVQPSKPFRDTGRICNFGNLVPEYDSRCPIGRVDYLGPDAVYEIQLTNDNSVGFRVTSRDGDFVLVLQARCDAMVRDRRDCDDLCCITSSPDVIGIATEEIPQATYPPGFYYLYIDTVERNGDCDTYELEVFGENPPEPDLALDIAASTNPVTAGENLTYTFTVTNNSPFSASGVMITAQLPNGVRKFSGPCEMTASRELSCPVGAVPRNEQRVRRIRVEVEPSQRAPLILEAEVTAAEKDPEESNNRDTLQTTVQAEADVKFVMPTNWPTSVTAGRAVNYSLRLVNDGPSTATGVVVIDTLEIKGARVDGLPECIDLIRPLPPGCTVIDRVACERTEVRCEVPELARDRLEPLTGTIRARIDPSFRGSVKNIATVTAVEDSTAVSESVTTDVATEVDFETTVGTSPMPAVAGDELSYRISVKNLGPSTATGISVDARFPDEVRVDRRPAACLEHSEEFTCPVRDLRPGGTADRMFLTTVNPSTRVSLPAIDVQVSAAEREIEPDPTPDENPQVDVNTRADLTLEKMASSNPVAPGDLLIYRLVVTNEGPSDARDVTVKDMLPDGVEYRSVVGCPGAGSPLPGDREVSCTFHQVRAHSTAEFAMTVEVLSSADSEVLNEATVDSKTPGSHSQPEPKTKTVAMLEGLVVVVEDSLDPVFLGGSLDYTLSVTNSSTMNAQTVQVVSQFSAGLSAEVEAVDCSDCVCKCTRPADEPTCDEELICEVNEGLPAGESISITVPTQIGGTPPGVVALEVMAMAMGFDTVTAVEETSFALSGPIGAALAVPRFVMNSESFFGPTTLYSVHNASRQPLILQIDYRNDEGTFVRLPEVRPLVPREWTSVNLRDVVPPGFPDPEQTGSVRISIFDPRTGNQVPARPVAGDFIHVEPGSQAASGSLLFDLERRPALRCTNWNVGYFGDDPFNAGTDLSVLLPNNPDSKTRVAATIYDAMESPKQCSIERETSLDSFQVNSEKDLLTCEPELAPSFGSIDLSFGVPGVAFATHRGDGLAVGAPGVCLDPSDTGRELLAPFYELSEGRSARINVRNTSDSPIMVEVECCDADGMPCMDIDVGEVLGHAVRDIELTDCPDIGFVQISTSEDVLAGEYILLPDADTAHGDALVNKDLDRVPADLCRRWDQRFVQEGEISTEVLVYLEDAEGQSAPNQALLTGDVFDEEGTFREQVKVLRDERAFRLTATDLSDLLPNDITSGTIEWRFRNDKIGHVAYILESGDMSVLIPAVCRDLGPPDATP